MKTKNMTLLTPARRPLGVGGDYVFSFTENTFESKLPRSTMSSARTISYETNGIKEFNRCTASKTEYKDWPFTALIPQYRYRTTGTTAPYSYVIEASASVPALGVAVNTVIPTVESATVSTSELDGRLYDASLSVRSLGMPRIMNLPLALVELRDVKGTLKAAQDIVRFARTLGSSSADRTVGEVARAYLAYTFGVKPTVGDVERFGKTFFGARVDVITRPIQYSRGDTVRAGFKLSREGDRQIPAPKVTVAPGGFSPGSNFETYYHYNSTSSYDWPTLRRYKSYECRGVCFGRVAKDYKVDLTIPQVISFNAPFLATAWAATPFSFVVDWFFDLSEFLSRMERTERVMEMDVAFDKGLWKSISWHTASYVPILSLSGSTRVVSFASSVGYGSISTTVTRSVSGFLCVEDIVSYIREPYTAVLPPAPVVQAPVRVYQLSAGAALLARNAGRRTH